MKHTFEISLEEFEKLSEIYKLFACVTRLKILTHLANFGESSASSLAEAASLSNSAASHQLKDLRAARIIKSRKEGKSVFYTLDDHHILHLLKTGIEHIQGEHCHV